MTTPEILQHYVTAGIDVRVMGAPGFTARLVGLSYASPTHNPVEVDSDDNTVTAWPYADVTPILKGFPDLCTPLEDGTVPAVEVAKLAVASDVMAKAKFGGYGFEDDACYGEYYYQGHTHRVWITPDFNVFEDDAEYACNQVAIIDYLRSKHFALPVNGKPLVEGTDYIRKGQQV